MVGSECPVSCYHGGMQKTQKVSVALRKDALILAKKAASASGLSLSGLLMSLLDAHFAQQEKFENMGKFMENDAPNLRVTEQQRQAIRDEMRAPLKPIQRARRKRAA
jgi:hypothetical protein